MTKWTMAYRELFVLTSLVILLPTLVGALCWREFVWFPLGLLATHCWCSSSSCATTPTPRRARAFCD